MESIKFVFMMELDAHLQTVGTTESGSTVEHFVLTDRVSPCQYLTIKIFVLEKKKLPIVFTTHIRDLSSQVFPYSVIVQEQ